MVHLERQHFGPDSHLGLWNRASGEVLHNQLCLHFPHRISPPSVVRGSARHGELEWLLNPEALRCTLPVGRKLKIEVLADFTETKSPSRRALGR